MKSLSLPSYAKVNFGLYITGKREDGYHEISTILAQISLKDVVELRNPEASKITFTCDDPGIPADASNLCVKAAELLRDEMDLKRGTAISLKKVVPTGAGLGGGSSNAAVVLLGLNRLWNLQLGSTQLCDMGVKLGADVPFFIKGGTAVAQGIGEILTPIDMKLDGHILIIFPGIEISTRWAYGQLNLDLTKKEKNLTLKTFKSINFNNVESLQNEFESVVFEKYPQLAVIKEKMYECGAFFASMSGSGSAMFGIFNRYEQALETREVFRKEYRTFLTQPMQWGYDQVS